MKMNQEQKDEIVQGKESRMKLQLFNKSPAIVIQHFHSAAAFGSLDNTEQEDKHIERHGPSAHECIRMVPVSGKYQHIGNNSEHDSEHRRQIQIHTGHIPVDATPQKQEGYDGRDDIQLQHCLVHHSLHLHRRTEKCLEASGKIACRYYKEYR